MAACVARAIPRAVGLVCELDNFRQAQQWAERVGNEQRRVWARGDR